MTFERIDHKHGALLSEAWSALEAARDFRDTLTIEAARRVIDALLQRREPCRTDLEIVTSYFGSPHAKFA